MDLYDLVVAPFVEFDFMRYALASIFCLALRRGACRCVFGDAPHEFGGRCLEPCGFARCGHWLYVCRLEFACNERRRFCSRFADGFVGRFGQPVYFIERRRELCRILFEQPRHRRGFGQQKRQQRRFAAFVVWLGVGGGYSGFAADCRFCECHYLLMAVMFRPLVLESIDPLFLKAVGGKGGFWHVLFLVLVVMNLVAGFQALGTLMSGRFD